MVESSASAAGLEIDPNGAMDQLIRDGFCVVRNVLDGAMLADLRRVTKRLLDETSAEHREHYKYQGSNIGVSYQDDVFARLIAWPKALDALRTLGFLQPKWASAYLLSKPPGAPPLYWHQDWWAWEEPCSASATPPQLFLMYYLTDTTRANGCLRVIPGTHRKRTTLHDQLLEAHTDPAYRAELNSPMFDDHPQALDVTVRAGDLVMGDARVLHAAHANSSNDYRTCLTLWYFPEFEKLSEPVQAAMARKEPLQPPNWWTGDAGKAVEPLIPNYSGTAQPAKFCRIPGRFLSES